MTPDATAWAVLALLVALCCWGDAAEWLEVRGEKRKAQSRRTLARKVQT